MDEQQIRDYLKRKGCPETVWKGGSHYLVQHWADFVSEVEKGYCPNCLIYEYWNDLDSRELIYEIGFDQDQRVKNADERFRAMLTATNIKHRNHERSGDYDLELWLSQECVQVFS